MAFSHRLFISCLSDKVFSCASFLLLPIVKIGNNSGIKYRVFFLHPDMNNGTRFYHIPRIFTLFSPFIKPFISPFWYTFLLSIRITLDLILVFFSISEVKSMTSWSKHVKHRSRHDSFQHRKYADLKVFWLSHDVIVGIPEYFTDLYWL